jgi:hypothetical protein
MGDVSLLAAGFSDQQGQGSVAAWPERTMRKVI